MDGWMGGWREGVRERTEGEGGGGRGRKEGREGGRRGNWYSSGPVDSHPLFEEGATRMSSMCFLWRCSAITFTRLASSLEGVGGGVEVREGGRGGERGREGEVREGGGSGR